MQPSSNLTIQDYLSIGYVYLLVLGVTSESIYYGFLDVNIISYSNILDVLLSPVAFITKGISFVIFLLVLPATIIFIISRIVRLTRKKLDSTADAGEIQKLKSKLNSLNGLQKVAPAIVIFSAYFGYVLGSGQKLKGKMESADLIPNTQITHIDGSSESVYLIGNNSQFLFYVAPDNSHVTISSIQSSIKKIEPIQN